jgi:hypothetical protein
MNHVAPFKIHRLVAASDAPELVQGLIRFRQPLPTSYSPTTTAAAFFEDR